ncbi:MAG: methyltransferase domain-containing protein, partial [Elusimicrobia bacterium]|nr:methyltransferase domain-containing protein [Elusimicrobiota bacterium]
PKKRIFIYWRDDLSLVVRTQQAKIPRIRELIALIGVKPGMTVLDIGAGTGQQSYLLARRVGPSGRVYATDIAPRLVDYMREEAARRGLKNLRPVLVRKDGVDPFYLRRDYDVILVSDIFSFLHDPAGYFAALRPRLKPGGRVVVVGQPDAYSYGFVPEDFKDWDGFAAAVAAEPDDGPFGRRIARPLRAALARIAPSDAAQRRRATLFFVNRALYDGALYETLADGEDLRAGAPLTPEERPMARWLLRRLRLAGVPGRVPDEILWIEVRDVVMLNKLALIARYRRFLRADPPHPYLPAGPEGRWANALNPVTAALTAAGYRLERDAALPPFQGVLVFGDASAGRGKK